MGQSGNVTLDAIKWCEAQGIAIRLLDWYGELLSVTQPALKADVAIRRAQFATNRLAIAKAILVQKTKSQARIGKLSPATERKALAEIAGACSVDEVITIEARVALEYWSNWRFELKHKRRNWPDQWTHFVFRVSPISGGPRYAMHPVNAILNWTTRFSRSKSWPDFFPDFSKTSKEGGVKILLRLRKPNSKKAASFF